MAERAEERSLMKKVTASDLDAPYQVVFGDVSKIVDAARDSATRSVNAAMTAAYWLIGHRIIEFEQSGEERARYGTALMERLAADLTQRFGRGFSRQNIQYMRLFYVSYPSDQIRQALSGKLARPPLGVGISFPLPEDTLSVTTREIVPPGEYRREITVTSVDGESLVISDQPGVLKTVTILEP